MQNKSRNMFATCTVSECLNPGEPKNAHTICMTSAFEEPQIMSSTYVNHAPMLHPTFCSTLGKDATGADPWHSYAPAFKSMAKACASHT